MTDIEAGDVLQMQDASLENIVAQINAKPWTLWPFIAFPGALLLVYLEGQHVGGNTLWVLAALLAVCTLFAAFKDKVRKTVVLMYELEGGAADAFAMLCASFDKLAKSLRIWNIDAQGSQSDWKKRAGATAILKRSPIKLSYGLPPTVRTNISVPRIQGGKQDVYFFPDVVLVINSGKAGAFAYRELHVEWSAIGIVQEGSVPRDSTVVRQTWQYVNKEGGPDKRFKNNRQLPVVAYQVMSLEGPAGLKKVLQFSRYEDRGDFDAAVKALASAHDQAGDSHEEARPITAGPGNTLLQKSPDTPTTVDSSASDHQRPRGD